MSGSLFNLDGLSQPAILLVEKISNAIGRHFDPNQVRRMALAEADADRIRLVSEAKTDIDITQLRQRTADRLFNEEVTKQINMDGIVAKAVAYVTDDASPAKIEDDWITNFFDKCRIVSDEEMQDRWARILAGEGNEPGSFSRKTINLMADLDKRDAELFTNLCRFVWDIDGTVCPLVYDTRHVVYTQHGINHEALSHLETLGLVQFAGIGLGLGNLSDKISASYHGQQLELVLPRDSDNSLSVGQIRLVQSGLELYSIVNADAVEGFFDYVQEKWTTEGLTTPTSSSPTAEPEPPFAELARRWKEESSFHSNSALIVRHPAYQQIIAMGEDAVPLILRDLWGKGGHWFPALQDITGAQPVPKGSWGNVKEMTAAWLQWGREQGYRW